MRIHQCQTPGAESPVPHCHYYNTIRMVVSTPLSIIFISRQPEEDQDIHSVIKSANHRNKILQAKDSQHAIELSGLHPVDAIILKITDSSRQQFKRIQDALEMLQTYPVIILSDRNNEIIATQAIRSGVQDFIVKDTLEPWQFMRCIHFAIDRHKIHRRSDESLSRLTGILEQQKSLLEVAQIGGWEMRLFTGELSVDERFCQIVGFSIYQEKLRMGEFQSMIIEEDKTVVADFVKALLNRHLVNPIHFRIRMPDQTIRDVIMGGRISDDGSDMRATGFLQETRPDHSVIALNQDNKHLSLILELRDRMMDELAFHVRTPMYSIVNFLYLLEDHPVRKEHKEAFEGLKVSVDELQYFLNRLMNYTTILREGVPYENKIFKLHQDLKTILHLMFTMDVSPNKPEYQVMIDHDIPTLVQGDPILLLRVLFTLKDILKNLASEPRKIRIQFSAEPQLGRWVKLHIQIRDSHHYDHELSIFRQIGLKDFIHSYKIRTDQENIIRMHMITLNKLVQAMNGAWDFDLQATGALKIQLEIPFEKIQTEISQTQSVQTWVEAIRILLVEDHFLNQIATKNVIMSWSEDFTVDIAENGAVAIEKHQANPYDLILMDIQMPVMNGIDAAIKIRQFSEVPIIALSAHGTEQEALRCKEAGMNAYLAKPFKPNELKNQVFRLASIIP